MIENIFLKLAIPGWLFFIIVIAVFGITYLYYYKTLPPLSTWRRIFLFLLRGIVLSILILLILHPILGIAYRLQEKPIVAILLDNSASMKLHDSYGMRGDSLQYLVSQLPELQKKDSLEIQLFEFARGVKKWAGDSLSFSEDGTNISQAIRGVMDSLAGKNLQAIVLVSDGIFNQGSNPALVARHSPLPIFSVQLGDTALPKDISIPLVRANSVTYAGKEFPMEIVLQQHGFDNRQVLLTVRDGQKTLLQKPVGLPRSGFEKKEEITIKPGRPGTHHYRVQIQEVDGETTHLNNQRLVTVQVLKSKIQVAVFSGQPNFDRHFLSFAAGKLKDFRFHFLTEKHRGEFYEGRLDSVQLDSQDVFIFHGFPSSQTPEKTVKTIFSSVMKMKTPVFWMLTRNSFTGNLSDFKEELPFRPFGKLIPEEDVFVTLTTGGILHPVTQMHPDDSYNQSLWSDLPPLEAFKGLSFREGNQVLLQSGQKELPTSSPFPILVVWRKGGVKQMILAGANFGFWHFQLQEDPERSEFFLKFLEKTLRWLVNREDINQVQILPTQKVYNVGETVLFSGQVFDAFYHPVEGAQIEITVSRGEEKISREMVPESNGYYTQSFSGLTEGEYRYQIVARQGKSLLGSRRGSIRIMPFYIEYQDIQGNASLLKELAASSGGRYYRVKEFLQKFPGSRFEMRNQMLLSELQIWQYSFWLFVLILLLALEWFFRKKWGLL